MLPAIKPYKFRSPSLETVFPKPKVHRRTVADSHNVLLTNVRNQRYFDKDPTKIQNLRHNLSVQEKPHKSHYYTNRSGYYKKDSNSRK